MKHDMHYRQPFWKLALGGILAGAALYFFPFLIPALAFVFLAGLLLRISFGHRHHRNMRYAYAARWQNMTAEQREAMRMKFKGHRCGPVHGPNDTTSSQPNS
ncbi:MAG TPA: hypothetical protein PLB89_01400 [Flavobacteriales bacterium]|nr:hypothetical protein [Flavobacteriales bacterium]